MPVHALTAAVKCDMNFIATDTTHRCATYGLKINFDADYEDMSIYNQHFLRLP